ncbi:MAG: hypothetical protein WBE26_05555 [Phycisphaerae bacterium]
MGQKRRKRKKGSVLEYRRLPTEELHKRIEEVRARGAIRAAIEMAKECYRRAATPEHVDLLGGLYVLRARELTDKDLHLEAFSVLNHALGLGYGSQELLHLAFECGLRGGQPAPAMKMFARVQEPALRARAARFLTDEAVVQGDEITRLCEPRVRDEASRIRRAFAAFERGDDRQAATELKSIGLRSPCAGWKWVVLGLLAYSRVEDANARSCWIRAGDEGRAGRVAGLLRSCLLNDKTPNDDSTLPVRGKLLSYLGNPRLAALEGIGKALAEKDDAKALNLAKQLLSTINGEEREAYARRLGRAMAGSLEWEPATWHRFRRVFGGFPEDPKLVRVTACRIERESPEDALEFWEHYLQSLPHVEAIPFRLRPRARALIWQRMGDIARETEQAEENMLPFAPFASSPPASLLSAVPCYRTSIKHYPEDLETHEKLLETLEKKRDRKAVEAQAEEILKRWPTHIDSLLLLGENCFHRQAFRKALKYFDRAREAEPFNTKINCKAQDCLLRSARRRLSKGNIDLARKDYEQAAALCRPPDSSSSHVYCQWAALEWRAGNPTEAERLYAQAGSAAEDLLVLHYQMAIELRRAQAPAQEQTRFNNLLKAEWKRNPSGAQAAAVAAVARQYEESNIRVDGCEGLQRSLWRYLKRACKKVSFTEEQLLGVCRYLAAAKHGELLECFAGRGAKEFQANYFFPMFLGRAQLRQGKWPLPDKTIGLLDNAGRQATQAGEYEVAREISTIITGGTRYTSKSIHKLLERVLLGAVGSDSSDFDDDPFDGLEDSEDDAVPRRTRSRRRDLDRDQMWLFDDTAPPEAESP